MTNNRAARYILLGQVSLYIGLIACVLLIPHFLFEANEGGVSNYGLYAKTVVPYTLGFGFSGVLTLTAAKFIAYKPLRLSCILVGALLILVLLSTYAYKFNQVLDNVHQALGAILAIIELGLGLWFAVFLESNPLNYMILVVQLAGFIVGVLTRAGSIHLLFVAEILTSLSFGLLLYRTVASSDNG